MCDADVGVMTYDWVKGRGHPSPDFNTKHKCRNFDDILRWGLAHQAPTQLGGEVLRTADADAKEMDMPP